MNRILVLGDIHGNWKDIRAIDDYFHLDESDTIIQLGDFGANFYLNERDDAFKKKLGKFKCQYFVIRGNHEERPSVLCAKTPDDWDLQAFFGSIVYVERKYPYIKYAADFPSQYNINGRWVLTLPGAYSVDKYYRIAQGWSWFEGEQMTEAEMETGRMFVKANIHWSAVFSHTCPIIYEPTDLFMSTVDQSTVDKSMERYLGELEHELDYGIWCWGHYHQTRVYPKFDESDRVMLFNDTVLDLNEYFETKDVYKSLIKVRAAV